MNRIAHRSSWIVGIVFLLLSVAVTVGSQPSVRSTLGIEPSAALPAPVPVESISDSLVQPTQPTRALTFEERVACQRRIEEVRWRYTIWPETNPTPKPALSEVLSAEAIRSKVEDALRKSSALEEYWQRPITAAQLQAEMDRMARGTRHAELLLDLFAALDHDPFLIAECLARPVLSDRLLRNWYAYDSRFHGDVGAAAESAMAGGVTASELPVVAEKYEEVLFEHAGLEDEDRSPGERGALRLDAEEWSEELRRLAGRFGVGRTAKPQGREFGGAVFETVDKAADEIEALFAEIPVGEVSALEETVDGWRAVTVLSKTEGSIQLGIARWPKLAFSTWWAAPRDDLAPGVEPLAGAYTLASVTGDAGCTPDTWRISVHDGAPWARRNHTAVWTGDRIIVWGGVESNTSFNTGGVYDPGTDSWTPTSVEGAPSGRYRHTAVWTGDRMIVWGGRSPYTSTGGVYDPGTDSWTPTSLEGAPSARYDHTAVWTGDRMIVWGGDPTTNTGGVYDPETDSWTSTSLEGAPSAREHHTAVWTGDRMIVWGGFPDTNAGGVYDPGTDSWTPTSTEDAPSERYVHTAVWTGARMIVWGGYPYTNTGGVYDPGTDSWTSTSLEGAPSARRDHTAVWTGDRMIVWGGYDGDSRTDTGGVYEAGTGSWTPTTVEGAPSPRFSQTAVWTGTRMIVWGGSGGGNTGGVYDPETDGWTPTSLEGAPSPRSSHTAVWTGARMIVWGGVVSDTGGVYDPATDSWTPTSVEDAPSPRSNHTAVWTGDRMIVWGGSNTNTGGVYDPETDSWTPTAVEDAPSPRSSHTAVWTGDRMIVWGGGTNTGGLYDPGTDSWTPTSVDGAPSARYHHTAVWTGDRMIVWGGDEGNWRPGDPDQGTGGVYNPGTDSWTPTAVQAAPPWRERHTAVWTGDRMIVWGGGRYLFDLYAFWAYTTTGGVYDPGVDSWTPTSVEGAPSARWEHTAVWTGDRMIVWGGGTESDLGGNPEQTGGVYDPITDGWTPTSVEGVPSERLRHTAIYTGSEMIIWGGDPLSNQLGSYCQPASPPSFTSPECGNTIHVEPGETVEFTVTAEDAPERTVALDVSGLPPDATMDPALPITGNPVSSDFTWTTDDSHNNTGHIVEFTGTNEFGSYARCRVAIEVADPTLVTLVSFTAIPGDGQVTLHWSTASEIDNAGFYLLRSTVAARGTVLLHKGLIPARGDVFTGADYSYVDETAVNGVEYEYTLVDVDLYGTETSHPPVRAIPNSPDPPVKLLSTARREASYPTTPTPSATRTPLGAKWG